MTEGKVRVYYASKDIGVTNKDLIAYLQSVGLYVTAQSTIPEHYVKEAREYFEENPIVEETKEVRTVLSSDEQIEQWDNYVDNFIKDKHYWHGDRIRKECPGATRYMLLSNRGPGKSTDTVAYFLLQAWFNDNFEFALLRRHDEEIKGRTAIADYFMNMTDFIIAMTHGRCNGVTGIATQMWLVYRDDVGHEVKVKKIGNYFALASAYKYKSKQYPLINDYIYEEFLNKDGRYLQNEAALLEDFEATLFRERAKMPGRCHAYLIGNTENRTAPYFKAWGLKDTVMSMTWGDIRTVRIHTTNERTGVENVVETAIEICISDAVGSSMAITRRGRTGTGGDVWTYDEHPKIATGDIYPDRRSNDPRKRKEPLYEELYTIYLHDEDFHFFVSLVCNTKTDDLLLYVRPNTRMLIPESGRVITTEFSERMLTTNCLNVTIKAEKLMRDLFKMNKIAYSSDMTGEDFLSIIKLRKGVL